MTGNFDEKLNFANLCGGALEEEFQKKYPLLLESIRTGDKASLNITVQFAKVKDTTTMFEVSYKITSKYPATQKTSICQIDGDNNLMTEKINKIEQTTIEEAIKNNKKIIKMGGTN